MTLPDPLESALAVIDDLLAQNWSLRVALIAMTERLAQIELANGAGPPVKPARVHSSRRVHDEPILGLLLASGPLTLGAIARAVLGDEHKSGVISGTLKRLCREGHVVRRKDWRYALSPLEAEVRAQQGTGEEVEV